MSKARNRAIGDLIERHLEDAYGDRSMALFGGDPESARRGWYLHVPEGLRSMPVDGWRLADYGYRGVPRPRDFDQSPEDGVLQRLTGPGGEPVWVFLTPEENGAAVGIACTHPEAITTKITQQFRVDDQLEQIKRGVRALSTGVEFSEHADFLRNPGYGSNAGLSATAVHCMNVALTDMRRSLCQWSLRYGLAGQCSAAFHVQHEANREVPSDIVTPKLLSLTPEGVARCHAWRWAEGDAVLQWGGLKARIRMVPKAEQNNLAAGSPTLCSLAKGPGSGFRAMIKKTASGRYLVCPDEETLCWLQWPNVGLIETPDRRTADAALLAIETWVFCDRISAVTGNIKALLDMGSDICQDARGEMISEPAKCWEAEHTLARRINQSIAEAVDQLGYLVALDEDYQSSFKYGEAPGWNAAALQREFEAERQAWSEMSDEEENVILCDRQRHHDVHSAFCPEVPAP